jgi:hypothetical protein
MLFQNCRERLVIHRQVIFLPEGPGFLREDPVKLGPFLQEVLGFGIVKDQFQPRQKIESISD